MVREHDAGGAGEDRRRGDGGAGACECVYHGRVYSFYREGSGCLRKGLLIAI